jgi:hypothetical protein
MPDAVDHVDERLGFDPRWPSFVCQSGYQLVQCAALHPAPDTPRCGEPIAGSGVEIPPWLALFRHFRGRNEEDVGWNSGGRPALATGAERGVDRLACTV